MKLGLGTGLDKNTQSAGSLLLDSYPDALGAYSYYRYLKSNYTGDIFLAERGGDNVQQGFTPTTKTDGTFVSFCSEGSGNGNGYTRGLYDQSGNSKDLIQTTHADQPLMVNSSVLQTGIQFDGVSDYLINSSFSIGSGVSSSIFIVFTTLSSATNDRVVSMINNTDTSTYRNVTVFSDQLNGFVGTTGLGSGGTITPGTFALATVIYNEGDCKIYKDGVEVVSSSVSVPIVNRIALGASLGASLGFFANISVKELIVFNSDQSANKSAIEAEINSYYSIY